VNREEKSGAGNSNMTAKELDELKQIKHLLRQAIPPLSPGQLQPRADLWPQLRARIESHLVADHAANANHAPSSIRIRVSWFDWALAALAAAALIFYPGIIPALLYHF
jgi:hypothetical protein